MFAEMVQAHRRRLGLTQEELAASAGLSVRSIGKLEGGRITAPRPATVRLLADVFGLAGTDRERFCQAAASGAAGEPAGSAVGPPAAGQTAAGQLVPRHLPADVPRFVGRVNDLARLDQTVADAAGGTTVPITVIAGPAGVGKTALALHFAHRVADRFPDGQLYINLRGFDPAGAPVAPAAAVRRFLDALQVPPQRVPPDLDAQVDLYRSLLARRRMLVVLDNARTAEQVRPLLPGAPGALVLVTSRYQLTGLLAAEGAVPLTLDLLPEAEARQLLVSRLGSERVDAEPAAVTALLAACAGLPLALAVLAAHTATRPGFALATLASEVRDADGKLEPWTGPDTMTDLRAVFSWSYHALEPAAARLFRLLGLHPGPDLTAPAAASLAGIPLATGRRLLAQLTDAHLLTEPTTGRYAFHDLLRAYAAELTHAVDSEPDRRTAVHRMLDHYLHTIHAARAQLDPHRPALYQLIPPQPGVVPVDLPDRERATAWLDAELAVLVEVIERGATGFHTHTWQLTNGLSHFLNRRGHHHQHLAIQRTALQAAQHLDDLTGQAVANAGIGAAHASLGNFGLAREYFQHALRLRYQLGVQDGLGYTHFNLAQLAAQQGDHHEALHHAQCAHETFASAGDRVGSARALNAVGWMYTQLGGYQQARDRCKQALAIQQQLDDTSFQGSTWDSLGYIHHQLGDHQQAVACYEQALTCYDRDSYAEGRGQTLGRLGDVHQATGRGQAARQAWQAALDIFQEINHPDAGQVRSKLDRLDGLAAEDR